MTKYMDKLRAANAFQQAAAGRHYEQCKNIITNFAHVYRMDSETVLRMISVMLMDSEGFSTEEFRQIKKAIRLAGGKCNDGVNECRSVSGPFD